MAGSIFHRKRRKLKSEINVVPYIDVMLVLLIIFMVTAPLLSLSVDVDLPRSQARAVDSRKDPVIVTVDAEGRYFLTVQGGKAEPLGGEELARAWPPSPRRIRTCRCSWLPRARWSTRR